MIFNMAVPPKEASAQRAVLDALPDWVWIRSLENGLVIEVNAAACSGLGYAREELIGRAVHELYFDAGDRELGRDFARRVKEGRSAYLTLTFRHKSGRPIEVEQHGSLAAAPDGRPAVLVVARDVGSQLRDKRLALTLYEAFRRSNDVMFYCDRNGVILDVNEAFVRHYGFTREEAIGQTPRILRSRHSSQQMYERMWSDITTKGFWRGEMINKTKEGKEIPLVLTITTVRGADGENLGYISNAVDVSDLRGLQARVADAETLARIGEMAAVVAHEIRNPLGSIVMAANQLASGRLPADDQKLVHDVLNTESRRLNETLTNFLSYARPRELKLQRLDLDALVGEVARMVQTNPDLARGLTFALELGGARDAQVDGDQIRQVVWNLTLNAVQAMNGRGTLTWRTGASDSELFIEVRDTGPGLSAKAKAGLFKPFHTTKKQGTGLGLAIADRVARAHAGRVDVDSAPGGTSFTLRLPRRSEGA